MANSALCTIPFYYIIQLGIYQLKSDKKLCSGSKESLEFSQYLTIRSFITFNKMVAFHKAGENDKAKELYDAHEAELSSMDLSEDERKDAMDRLDHEVSYYKIFE